MNETYVTIAVVFTLLGAVLGTLVHVLRTRPDTKTLDGMIAECLGQLQVNEMVMTQFERAYETGSAAQRQALDAAVYVIESLSK